MGAISINHITVTPLKRFYVPGGDVLHALKRSDPGFSGFGEAYFSMIERGAVKAWKRHHLMTLNLVVPLGTVRFVFVCDSGTSREESIGENRYARITVPPGIWFGFQGLAAPNSLVLNIADIPHDPNETERKEQNFIEFGWEGVQ